MIFRPLLISIPLTLILSFFTSCSPGGEDARLALIEALEDGSEVKDHLSKNSFAYFDELVTLINAGDAEGAKMLGDENDCPYTTLETFYSFGDWGLEADSTNAILDGEMVNFYLLLTGTGMYGAFNDREPTITENVVVTGDRAKVEVHVPTGPTSDTKIATHYTLVKEGNAWKVDVTSTFQINELIRKQLHRKQRNSIQTFARSMANDAPEVIEFGYYQ